MSKITPVVIAIIHDGTTFLLTERRKENIWHFPGGEVEFGEDCMDALKREIKEELSLEITIHAHLPKVYSAVRNKWHGILIPYICTAAKTQSIILNDEAVRFGWFTKEEIQNVKTLSFVNEMAEDASAFLKQE